MIARPIRLRPHESAWTISDRWKLVEWCLDHIDGLTAVKEGGEEDTIYNIPNETLKPVLQSAMQTLLPHTKHKNIISVTQFAWFRPMLIEALRKRLSCGHFPVTLQLPLPTLSKPPSEPAGLGKILKRQIRQEREIKALRRDIEALSDLILEGLSQLTQTAQINIGPPGPKGPDRGPLRDSDPPSMCPKGTVAKGNPKAGLARGPEGPLVVAIVGVRRHQQEAIKKALKGTATVEFVDHARRQPDQLMDFDHVFCVKCTPEAWKRRAIHILAKKFVESHGTRLIIEAIERLAGVSV